MKKFIFIICLLLLACSVNAQAVHNGPFDAGAARENGNASEPFKAEYIEFNTATGTPAYKAGRTYYDTTEGVLSFMPILNGPILQIGQENWIWAYNNTGATILDGQAVYIGGALAGTIPIATLAQANASATADTMAVCTADVAHLGYGFFTTSGKCNGLDTSGYTAGDILYLSGSVAGGLTNVIPASPNFIVRMGRVLSSDVTNGSIYIDIDQSGSTENAVFAKDVDIQARVKAAWAEITGNVYASGSATIDGAAHIGGVLTASAGARIEGGEVSIVGVTTVADTGSLPLVVKRTVNNNFAAGGIAFNLLNSISDIAPYAYLFGGIEDNTDGSEDGFISVHISLAGVLAEKIRITSTGNVVINQADDGVNKLQITGNAKVRGDVEVLGTSGASKIVTAFLNTPNTQITDLTTLFALGAEIGELRVVVTNTGSFGSALYFFDNTISTELYDVKTTFTPTKDNAGTINVYMDAGKAYLQNNSGNTLELVMTWQGYH